MTEQPTAEAGRDDKAFGQVARSAWRKYRNLIVFVGLLATGFGFASNFVSDVRTRIVTAHEKDKRLTGLVASVDKLSETLADLRRRLDAVDKALDANDRQHAELKLSVELMRQVVNRNSKFRETWPTTGRSASDTRQNTLIETIRGRLDRLETYTWQATVSRVKH